MFLGTCLLGKKILLSELLDLDTREGLQVLSLADGTRKTEIKANIEYLAFLEAEFKGFDFKKEGDNNARLFHRLTNSHKRANKMRDVEVDDIMYKADSDIQDQVVGFYKNLYRESKSWRPIVDGLEFSSLDESERLSLERDFEKRGDY